MKTISRYKKTTFLKYLLFIIIAFNIPQIAQPSGGPYGPMTLKYNLPKVNGTIYYVAPGGDAETEGTSLDKPTTIEAAFKKARTGDAIILRGGVYRTGNLIFNQGITIQPYMDEQPVLKGTYVADKWEDLGNGLWITKWERLFPSKPQSWWRRNREGKKTPLHKFNNDMVFVDGKFLQSAGWEGEVDENSFYIDYERGLVYIGVNPKNHLIEITAFDAALIRTTKEVNGKSPDNKGFKLRGITLTQYAYRAIEIEGKDPEGLSDEKNHGKDVIGTVIENCSITYCSRVAGYFRGDSLVIRNCLISDTSTEGLYILSSSDVLLEKNIIKRNNIERITGYYPAAVKIFNQCYRVTCNDNLVIDHPYSNGIWYDVGNVDGVFINNWIENIGDYKSPYSIERPWPSDNGFFFEISKGAVCAGNVFVNCDHGVWALNSSNVKFYNNTFINSMACISRNERSAQGDHFGWHPSTGPDVDERVGHEFVNNLLYADESYNRPLLYVWQPASICDTINDPQVAKLDYNVYVHKSDNPHKPAFIWSPADNKRCQFLFDSYDEFAAKFPQYTKNSKYFKNYNGPLFKSVELHNLEVLKGFPASNAGTDLPAYIEKLIRKRFKSVGAYIVK
ncbi:right-handed parallel beta-helix repeat-containing protein [Melioribacter sp. Ez-97]|uniref:right-handed parallel beta-helix repeat-containing protein n=1 Tax=Melioribacter sp. Ez-97 TaxID=3423434 RepID=UPI003ED98912